MPSCFTIRRRRIDKRKDDLHSLLLQIALISLSRRYRQVGLLVKKRLYLSLERKCFYSSPVTYSTLSEVEMEGIYLKAVCELLSCLFYHLFLC